MPNAPTRKVRRKETAGQLNKLNKPEFVTVVDVPANRTGFRMVRGEEDAGKPAAALKVVTEGIRKRKRSDANLVSIVLPQGIDRSVAEEVVEMFALGEGYALIEEDDSFIIRRTNASDKETFAIDMGEGFTANIDAASIARADTPPPNPGKGDQRPGEGVEKNAISLVRVDFDEKVFAEPADVAEWCTMNGLPSDNVVENEDGYFSVNRYDTEAQTRVVRLGDGVVGYVIRAERADVPEPLYSGVVSEAYGSWGWGQLNFAAAMADPRFTEQSWDALYVLRDVLENIVFYSSLPVDERKGLVKGACDQYVAYMGQLIDALPKIVVEQVNNSDRNKLETVMKVEAKKAEEQAAPEQLTRSDVEEMITAAVTAAMAAPAAPAVATEPAAVEPVAPVVAPVVERSDDTSEKVLTALAGVVAQLECMDTEVKGLKGTVEDTSVVRSEPAPAVVPADPKPVKRTESIFAGVFNAVPVFNAGAGE